MLRNRATVGAGLVPAQQPRDNSYESGQPQGLPLHSVNFQLILCWNVIIEGRQVIVNSVRSVLRDFQRNLHKYTQLLRHFHGARRGNPPLAIYRLQDRWGYLDGHTQRRQTSDHRHRSLPTRNRQETSSNSMLLNHQQAVIGNQVAPFIVCLVSFKIHLQKPENPVLNRLSTGSEISACTHRIIIHSIINNATFSSPLLIMPSIRLDTDVVTQSWEKPAVLPARPLATFKRHSYLQSTITFSSLSAVSFRPFVFFALCHPHHRQRSFGANY